MQFARFSRQIAPCQLKRITSLWDYKIAVKSRQDQNGLATK